MLLQISVLLFIISISSAETFSTLNIGNVEGINMTVHICIAVIHQFLHHCSCCYSIASKT